ncbi:GDSL esterase/lipase EXL3-like isoform X2 [Actinidia eriantha]|uniref:GDSL esterase/lipase EXL3-like isoform X2 n=1 Tax=Actinidia eriantha TaxID=165200 RepID=UPI00258B2D9F|nr:GDSL esterase/lipase EXL3-like isoform X2 [Actinidia eriantha]
MKLSSSSSSVSSCSIVLYFVYVLVVFRNSTEAVVRLSKNVTFPAILVFGDSIVDQGNNNNLKTIVKCNFPPYGKDFMGGTPTGRFSNGRTPADLIAEELGIKELVPAYLDPHLQPTDLPTGVSFASGATGFDPETPRFVSVLSLSDQLEMFKDYIGKLKAIVGEERTKDILTNSIYLVIAGSDDLANTYFTIGLRKLQYDINSYTNLLVQSASKFTTELYGLGAKRIAIFGIPPIGCMPSQRTLTGGGVRECAEKYNQAAQLFNTKLSSAISSLTNGLNDTKARMVYIDIYNPLLDLIQNPGKYDKGCCGTGKIEVSVLCNKLSEMCLDDSVYLFWDSYHPTERGYNVLVNQILQKYINNFV